jgi:hypothetical protein
MTLRYIALEKSFNQMSLETDERFDSHDERFRNVRGRIIAGALREIGRVSNRLARLFS